MGKVPGEKASWGALENHPERATMAGVLVLRINESLFWVNATRAHDGSWHWSTSSRTGRPWCWISSPATSST